MSGHSKWKKIKHQKAATDATKSKIFGKLVRYLTVEAKKAKGDRNAPGVRLALDKAHAANMPSDTIERALEKGAADTSTSMETMTYEAYGPGGTALLIDTLTDNRNRTAAEIKHLLGTHGIALATPGSAAWAFTKGAEGLLPTATVDLSDEDLAKLSVLVQTLEDHDDVQNVYTNAA